MTPHGPSSEILDHSAKRTMTLRQHDHNDRHSNPSIQPSRQETSPDMATSAAGSFIVKCEDRVSDSSTSWPARPPTFGELLTPIEAAQYLRLDETNLHTPTTAVRTLKYWRDRGVLRATKFARRVWYLKPELDLFLRAKTES